jgi:hypothetical protein
MQEQRWQRSESSIMYIDFLTKEYRKKYLLRIRQHEEKFFLNSIKIMLGNGSLIKFSVKTNS